MNSNYKRLGDYIRQVDIRNRDLAVNNLLGLSNTKEFIPSIANTIGTDLGGYKIVTPRQFSYVPVTSRNGDKITVALYSGEKPCIVSQAYIVFEVINFSELLPEYLMMWFRRSEFDRYARFKSHGSARESFDWDEMCEVMLPVPTIEEQQKIVAEYQAIELRIENNRRLIATHEATAQSIYRHLFVDNIDPENLPDGWRLEPLSKFIHSFSKTHAFNKENLIFLNTSDILDHHLLKNEYEPISEMPGQAKKSIRKHDLLFSEIRPANKRYLFVRFNAEDFVVSTKLMVLRTNDDSLNPLRFVHFLTLPETLEKLQHEANGSSGTFPQITFEGNIANKQILIADDMIESQWNNFLNKIYGYLWTLNDEVDSLKILSSLILTKLSR